MRKHQSDQRFHNLLHLESLPFMNAQLNKVQRTHQRSVPMIEAGFMKIMDTNLSARTERQAKREKLWKRRP